MHKDLHNLQYLQYKLFLKESSNWHSHVMAQYQAAEIDSKLTLALSTPGYKKLYSGHNLTDFKSLPFITKEMIQGNVEDYTVQSLKAEYVTTGGSTGIPFGFYRGKDSFAKELAAKAHQYERLGWSEHDRQFVIRGIPIDNPTKMEYIDPLNELRVSSYYLTDEYCEGFLQEAIKFQPRWIKCYPSSGYLFARWLKDNNKKFPKVDGIFCASENLYDSQKELLQEVFGCRVFSHYGHYELAALAGFCEHRDTYHVLPQYGFVELLDENNNEITTPGKTGEIVATSFIMDGTLFIRYRTGDLATYDSNRCEACGRDYLILNRIDGRLQEYIVTKAGRKISGTAINFHTPIFDCIKQFQFVQNSPGIVDFLYIPYSTVTQGSLDEIKKALSQKTGDDIIINYKEVTEIPLTKRGKHRFIIQNLKVDVHDD